MVDQFAVICTGWTNCLGVDNDRLTYKYYVAYQNQTAPWPLYSALESIVNLYFPVGDEDDDYRNQLTVIATNDANYAASLTIYPVTVS